MDGPRTPYRPTGGGPPDLRRRIMLTLGQAIHTWRTLADAATLADTCGMTRKRARVWIRQAIPVHPPHDEARRVVCAADRLVGIPHEYERPDFALLVRALASRGYPLAHVAARWKVDYDNLWRWYARLNSPGWLSGELLLHAWQAATQGSWLPASAPLPCPVDPGHVPEPSP